MRTVSIGDVAKGIIGLVHILPPPSPPILAMRLLLFTLSNSLAHQSSLYFVHLYFNFLWLQNSRYCSQRDSNSGIDQIYHSLISVRCLQEPSIGHTWICVVFYHSCLEICKLTATLQIQSRVLSVFPKHKSKLSFELSDFSAICCRKKNTK